VTFAGAIMAITVSIPLENWSRILAGSMILLNIPTITEAHVGGRPIKGQGTSCSRIM
jgi:hypothetical protein